MPSEPLGRSAHGVTGRLRGQESLFLGVNFVNFPDVWNLGFCSVRRVNLGEVSGGVASPSVAPMQDKKDLGALGTGVGCSLRSADISLEKGHP